MNPILIIVVAILWVSYGIFTARQSGHTNLRKDLPIIIIAIIFSPIILLIRAVYGVLSKNVL